MTTQDQLSKIIAVEKTPEYIMMPPEHINRVHRLMPSLRLIVSLRDPVDRLYSWFHFKCNPTGPKKPRLIRVFLAGPNKGQVVSCEDEAAVAALPHPSMPAPCTPDAFDRLVLTNNGTSVVPPGDAGVGHAVRRGVYADQLRAWFDVFPKSQFFFLFSGKS
jgi:hypothetical protein